MGEPADLSRRAQNIVIAVLTLAGVGAAFMQTILIPLQPQLPQLLSTSRENAAWVITTTLVAGAVCTPIAGRLGDMFGKRRVAMVLLGLQAAGSIVAALSSTFEPMIAARVLQGMAAGVIPLGISILRDVIPKVRLGATIALVSASLGAGGVLGLPLSAAVAEILDWHWLFWLAAGITVLCLGLFAVFVPVSTVRAPGRVDLVGIVGLSVGLVGLLVGISRGGEWGWTDPRTLASLVGGAVILAGWGVVELRTAQPLVDLRVSARAPVLLTNLASVAMGFALFLSNIVFPQLLGLPAASGIGLGMSVVVSALILAPSGITMLAVSPLAGRWERRHGPRALLVAGAAIIAASYAGALVFHDAAWQILLVNLVFGVGFGLGYGAMPALIMSAVPVNETGAANGLNALMRALGTSAAAAVAGAVLAQSVTTAGGVTGPGEDGFLIVLGLGLGSSIVCLVIAAFIRPPRAPETG